MKFKFVFSVFSAAMVGVCLPAQAQEVGRVLSSTPLIQQVSVPRQVCSTEQVAVEQPKSGAGALMGAIAGGAIGNQIGHGAGNAAATMLGLMGGAVMGDRIEGAPPAQLQNVQRCTTQNMLENRTLGYQVVYEYAGKQYSVQMPSDPGPTIALQVAPAGSSVPAPAAAPTYTTVVPANPAPVVISAPPPVVYYSPYYAPYYGPSVNLRWGEWDRRHWR